MFAEVDPNGAIQSAFTTFQADAKRTSGPPSTTSELDTYFDSLGVDVVELAASKEGDDVIRARLQAWAVVEEYNQVLVALATGRSPEEIRETVDGLLSSLTSLPDQFSKLTSLATKIVPYAEGVAFVIELIEKAIAERRFRDAVDAAAPLIDGLLTDILIPDAQVYYDVRIGLFFADVVPQLRDIRSLGRQFSQLAKGHTDDTTVSKLLEEINDELKRLPMWDMTNNSLRSSGTGSSPDIEKLAQLLHLRSTIGQRIESVLDADATLQAFREAVVSYAQLLGLLRETNRALLIATQSAQAEVPSPEAIAQVIVQARTAIAVYKSTR